MTEVVALTAPPASWLGRGWLTATAPMWASPPHRVTARSLPMGTQVMRRATRPRWAVKIMGSLPVMLMGAASDPNGTIPGRWP
jgi:hypothetical protein